MYICCLLEALSLIKDVVFIMLTAANYMYLSSTMYLIKNTFFFVTKYAKCCKLSVSVLGKHSPNVSSKQRGGIEVFDI